MMRIDDIWQLPHLGKVPVMELKGFNRVVENTFIDWQNDFLQMFFVVVDGYISKPKSIWMSCEKNTLWNCDLFLSPSRKSQITR